MACRREGDAVPAVQVRILGPIEVVGPDGTVRPGGPKDRCLLAVLAVHAGEVVAEDRLVDALWGGSPPRTATRTVQNYVLRLRRALRGCEAATIVTRPPGYVLDVATTDARLAESLITEGRRAAERGAHAIAIGRLDEALALWRGPSIDEFADRLFARAEAARLDELREAAAEDRLAAMLALNRHHEAIATCETLVAAQPLRERRWIQLMLALYRDGRQADALDAYRRLRTVLADQLGVDPGPAARRTEAAILAHDRSLLPHPAPARTAGQATIGMATTPYFGRDRELSTLLGYVADAESGRGGVVLVCGEPGIGKSRLLAELAAVASARGSRVLFGRCVEGAGALPFQPFVEALETFLGNRDLPDGTEVLAQLRPHRPGRTPTSDPPLRPDELRLRMLDGVVRFLGELAAQAPVVLLLDDLQWADDGSMAMLRHTSRMTRNCRLLVVSSYRTGEVTAEHPLGDALGSLRSDADCSTLPLSGIGRDAVEQLLAAATGAPIATDLASAVYAETDGNPFFAREIARHLHEEGALHPAADGRLGVTLPLSVVPEGVRQVIGRRRRRLSGAANRLLDVAAGIDGPFPFEPVRVIAALSDVDALGALDDVLEAGLVVPDIAPDRYGFTHALIRHTVYQGLNPSRRLRLHRDLGQALTAARSNGVRIAAAEVAVQYHRAAALPAVAAGVAPALEAADGAQAVGAHDEQATFLKIALDLLPPGDSRHTNLLGRRAVALAWSLRFDDAVDVARATVTAGAEPPVVAEVASVLATAGSNRHAWQLSAAALGSTTGPNGDDPVTWAGLTLLDLDRREATDPDHPGMPLDLPGRRTALRILHESGGLAERGDLARYAVAAVHGRRDRIPAEAAADPTVAAYLIGDYAAAVPLFTRDADVAEERGQLALAVYCRAGAGRCQVALGDIDAGTATIMRSRTLVERLSGLEYGWQLLHHQGAEDALVMARDEGWSERVRHFAPWIFPGPPGHWGTAAIAGIGARALARMGRLDDAMAQLARPVRALSMAPAWAPNYGRMACEVAETLWLLDRRDHLAVVESALRDKALPADFRFPMTDARLALARLCALDGRQHEARHWFESARAVLDSQGARPLRAVVDHDEALMHRRSGNRAGAAPFVAAATAAFQQLRMTGWLRRLARAGGP